MGSAISLILSWFGSDSPHCDVASLFSRSVYAALFSLTAGEDHSYLTNILPMYLNALLFTEFSTCSFLEKGVIVLLNVDGLVRIATLAPTSVSIQLT